MGNQSSIAVLPMNHEEELDRLETPRIHLPDIVERSPDDRSSRKRVLDKFIQKMNSSYPRDRKKRFLEKAIQRFPCEKLDVAVTFAWTFKYLILLGQFAGDVKYTKEIEEMEKRFLHGVLQKDMEFWVDKSIFFCRFFTFHKAIHEIHEYKAWDNITFSHAIFQKHFWEYVSTHYLDKFLLQEWDLVHMIEKILWEEVQRELNLFSLY
jgi:hypothetical protein